MRTSRTTVAFAAVLLLTLGLDLHAAAPSAPSHIRTTSACLKKIIDAGIDRSATFRDLVGQLQASDVVVYVSFRMFNERDMGGQIVFVGAAAGVRYLQVFVTASPDPNCLAMLGHELQHAMEIAATPSVVDSASFTHYYTRIGYNVGPHSDRFDTNVAVESGQRVLREALTTARGNDGP